MTTETQQEKQMDYIILQDSRSETLAYEVTYKMQEGYKPVGGVSVSVAPGGWTLFAQAMVKAQE
jgi:vacuolar-type H+-ATPase subunit E/Vma4